MRRDQWRMPLFEKLTEFASSGNISFHVPGHKNGTIFMKEAIHYYRDLLPLDLTEIPGLDDLHAPKEVIAEAEQLAADYFKAKQTFFLVGGSTAGNLAMIMAACSPGEKIIVQRNSHKSIMNGLELANACPVFIAPEYDTGVGRYTHPDPETLETALGKHPDAQAVVLTYPDYFGRTYDIEKMIKLAHQYQMPVLVDEAHGVHFSLGDPFPSSALALGADVVVQSAHKMAPAMTMASYLHMKPSFIKKERVAHFLQMIQSSSPSYPLMASLDIARAFLAGIDKDRMTEILRDAASARDIFKELHSIDILPVTSQDDPLKTTLYTGGRMSGTELARLFEQEGIYPELATERQVLFIHGLAPFRRIENLKKAVEKVRDQLKINENHGTIEAVELFTQKVQELDLSYLKMNRTGVRGVPLHEAAGKIAAEPVIPYPPGIPLILKGEEVTETHIALAEQLLKQGVVFQHRGIHNGITVFDETEKGE